MSTSVKELVQKLVEAGIVNENRIVGCTEDEIQSIEREYNVVLPHSYKTFLRLMGRNAGDFYAEAGFYYPALLENRRIAENVLRESSPLYVLSPTQFVFLERFATAILFFDTATSDDPPVNVFDAGDFAPRKVAKSFNEWLELAVDDEVRDLSELQALRAKDVPAS